MSLEQYRSGVYDAGVPIIACEDVYYLPPDLGGLRANYPIVSQAIPFGLFNEVVTDWDGPGSQLYESVRTTPMEQRGDVQMYAGNVQSIQLTARPGYYVSPQFLEAIGYEDDEFPPIG